MDITKIVQGMKVVIVLIPVFLILLSAISLLHVGTVKEKIPFRERMGRVRGRIALIVLITLVYTACFAGIKIIQAKYEGSVTIGLNYAKASTGLNPNGTRFNSYDIVDNEVLERAIEDGKLADVTVAQLRAALSIEPLHASGSSSEQYYVSTEYVLEYNATKNTKHLDGETVVKAVADAYSDLFDEKYSRKTTILDLDYTSLDEADYLDKVDIFNNIAASIKEYLWSCNDEDATFTGENGETFASLATKLGDFQDIELERYEAYVLTKGLSSDKDTQVAKLEYDNLIKDYSQQKSSKAYDVRLETVAMYERDMATIVLVPTVDEEGEFYMGRTKIAVDNFADEAETYSQTTAQTNQSISDNTYAINQLNSSVAGENEYATANNMVTNLKETLSSYAEESKTMIEAFDAAKNGNFLIITMEPFSLTDATFLLKAAIMMAAMAIALIAFIATKQEKKESAARRTFVEEKR